MPKSWYSDSYLQNILAHVPERKLTFAKRDLVGNRVEMFDGHRRIRGAYIPSTLDGILRYDVIELKEGEEPEKTIMRRVE